MRLFVALDVSNAVRRRVQDVIDRVERELGSPGRGGARRSPSVRWVSVERLHLTLHFIGEVSDDLTSAVEARLAPPFPLRPFDIALAGLGVFPPSGAPRVVWIGIAAGAPAVASLQSETVRRLADLPLRAEQRPFSAHLTIGRFRTGTARDRRRLHDLPRVDVGRCTIDHVTLYQSRLSPTGPSYVPRLLVPLSA